VGEIVDVHALRRRVLGELVSGKTFVEIGGLWGTVNEMVSVALQAGAREATMIDVMPRDSKWWTLLEERCAEFGVADYHCVVGNICEDGLAESVGRFDIAHCSGVLYHTPNPLNVIRNLIAMTRERFMLTSATVPPVISNRAGRLALSPGQCLLVPALDDSKLAIVREHFRERRANEAHGITLPGTFVVDNQLHGWPWWWLFTAETLVNMCSLFDVEIEDTWCHIRRGQPHVSSTTVLARIGSSSRPA